MAAAEKEFDGQICLKRRTILRLGVPKERGLFATTSGGRTKASPKRDRRSGTRRSRVKRANSSGKDERSEFLTGEEQNKGSYQSGQMGQTVNLLAYAFGGSNPSLPTKKRVPVGVAGPRTPRRDGAREGITLIRSVFCGSSSVDRALAFQAKGREFEPRLPLHYAAACDANASVERWGVCVARLFCEMNFKTLGQFLTIL